MPRKKAARVKTRMSPTRKRSASSAGVKRRGKRATKSSVRTGRKKAPSKATVNIPAWIKKMVQPKKKSNMPKRGGAKKGGRMSYKSSKRRGTAR